MPSPRILIVRTDRLGDVVLTLAMARAIKTALPEAIVGFLCREYTRPIVERCPDIDEVVVRPDRASLRSDIELLKSGHWGTAFFPNARPDLAIAGYIAGIPRRVGTAYRWYSILFNERIKEHRKKAKYNEAVFNLRMLRSLAIDASPEILPSVVLRYDEIVATEHWRSEHLNSHDRKYAVLHIGSGGSSHSWPIESWIALARDLASSFNIVLTGSPSELSQLEGVVSRLHSHGVPSALFVGQGLPELAALLAAADLVVSGSTGPGHLAAALGTHTIGLFPLPLALSKERWGFRGRDAVNLSPPALPDCPTCENCTCMHRIDPKTVVPSTVRV